MTYPTFQPPAIDQASEEPRYIIRSLVRLAEAFKGVLQGKLNVRKEITLTANAASTTITDPRASVFSYIGFMPLTANARDEYLKNGTMHVSQRNNGSYVVAHANNAQTDRTFVAMVIG